MTKPRILIVDDERDLRWVLRSLFEDAGFAVTEAADGMAARTALPTVNPDVVLSDVRMPGLNGTQLLQHIRKELPDLPVILLSAVEDIATAVGAIKEGAFDWQAKPFDQERLLHTVQRAAEQHALRRQVHELRNSLQTRQLDFGPSVVAQNLRRTIELVAPQPSLAVLIVGESGTGKEVVARALHRCSPVAGGPFVAIDCGALPEPLMESQLFGHRRGAFTGADRDRPGLFQMADGGSLFLDEIGNLPPPLQAKLLRALQERAVTPVGGSEPVPFTARLLAATNAALEADVRAGRFRVDLYHRLAEFALRLPPLRERREDVLHFARIFIAEANAEMGRHVQDLLPAASALLTTHDWPGNLRELRNVIRRAVLLCTSPRLDACDLDLSAGALVDPGIASAGSPAGGQALGETPLPLAEHLRRANDQLEARLLQQAIADANGNKAAAARALQIDYTTLHRKLKRHGLPD
ncbi:MAG: sigma-54-dependent Fis family transcriptional regulator [Planctomycetes bacterium]|nr:sigma-54-dependent Fis family transcriptional regulator [Planctomycetota bacterium]